MAGEVPQHNQYVTFEVTVPQDSAEGINALRGMVTALGWHVRQRATLPTDLDSRSLPHLWRITDEQFLETSDELWGSQDYGHAAIERTNLERHGGVVWANGEVNMHVPDALQGSEFDGVPFIPRWLDHKKNPDAEIFRGGKYSLSDEALLRRAQALWDGNHLPFTLIADIKDTFDFKGGRYIDLKPGDVTRERLADYVRAHGYDRHSLHGTLGKMLDTINVTSGVVEKRVIGERDVDTDFVETGVLDQMMKDAGLTTRASNDIRGRLHDAVREQYETGKPYKHGEITLEGKSIWQYERVAVSSLAVLVHSFKSKKETPATRFLKQFT